MSERKVEFRGGPKDGLSAVYDDAKKRIRFPVPGDGLAHYQRRGSSDIFDYTKTSYKTRE